jgi:hypothetical protein
MKSRTSPLPPRIIDFAKEHLITQITADFGLYLHSLASPELRIFSRALQHWRAASQSVPDIPDDWPISAQGSRI